jgi:twitching motility protein PilT
MSVQELILGVSGLNGLSDIHLHQGRPPAARINGDIQNVGDNPVSQLDLEEFIKPNLADRLARVFEEKGDVDLAIAMGGMRFRASFARGSGGLAIILRKLSDQIPTPQDLRLPSAALQILHKHSGLVLVTGPTGSGKSTSLASMIDQINEQRPAHILTIEDPIEYVHQDKRSIVFQREVGRDASSFAQALRAALREDPDVILLGEMRDLETVSLALTAAETGHLVFGTLHTSGAPNTINRIIDVFPPEQQGQIRSQLSQSLQMVMTQRLFPKKGGGRVAAFEVMLTNPAIANLIRENKVHQISNAMSTGMASGMITMDRSIQELVGMGEIDAPV